MFRRKQNSSRPVKGGEMIKWHLELRFINAGVVHYEKCVPDTQTLLQVRENLFLLLSAATSPFLQRNCEL
jgi:hypothetical protein